MLIIHESLIPVQQEKDDASQQSATPPAVREQQVPKKQESSRRRSKEKHAAKEEVAAPKEESPVAKRASAGSSASSVAATPPPASPSAEMREKSPEKGAAHEAEVKVTDFRCVTVLSVFWYTCERTGSCQKQLKLTLIFISQENVAFSHKLL